MGQARSHRLRAYTHAILAHTLNILALKTVAESPLVQLDSSVDGRARADRGLTAGERDAPVNVVDAVQPPRRLSAHSLRPHLIYLCCGVGDIIDRR